MPVSDFPTQDPGARTDSEWDAAMLRPILKSLPDAVYIGTAQGIGYTNELGYRMLGFESGKELRQEISRLGSVIQVRDSATGRRVRPDELVFAKALNGEAATQEVLVRNVSTGEDLVVRSSASPIRLEGKTLGAVAINTDITSEKHAEAQLRKQANVADRVIRGIAEAIFLLDRNGRITFVNPAAECTFGWSARELSGQFLHDVLQHRAPEKCPYTEVLTRGQIVGEYEDVFEDKNGHPVPVTCSPSPLLDGGEITGAVLVVRDITERRQDLQSQRDVRRLESIRQLASGVAHEYNNLLVGILGNASLLIDELQKDDPNLPLLEDIFTAGERAAELTRQLRTFSGKDSSTQNG